MANIAVVRPTELLAAAAWTASTPSGDKITGVQSNHDLILEVENGHTTGVTVAIPTTSGYSSLVSREYGLVTKAGPTAVVPTTQHRVVVIPAEYVRLFLTASGVINVNYTGGNAGLLVRALQRA